MQELWIHLFDIVFESAWASLFGLENENKSLFSNFEMTSLRLPRQPNSTWRSVGGSARLLMKPCRQEFKEDQEEQKETGGAEEEDAQSPGMGRFRFEPTLWVDAPFENFFVDDVSNEVTETKRDVIDAHGRRTHLLRSFGIAEF